MEVGEPAFDVRIDLVGPKLDRFAVIGNGVVVVALVVIAKPRL
jgi:hypothetical protein